MLKKIDALLNAITMYRLVLYYLAGLVGIAFVFSALTVLPYNPLWLLLDTLFLLAVGWLTNYIFSVVFEAPTNSESVYITGLILALIITPASPSSSLWFLLWAAVWGSASKFIFAINRKHIFNPAAIAVAITSFAIGQSASWWVGGSVWMLPFVLVGGLLIARKTRRTSMIIAFLLVSLIATIAPTATDASQVFSSLMRILVHTPLFFFAFVMLTEPLTTPPQESLRLLYGGLVGFLFAPWVHISAVYLTPELALLIGNVCSWLVSPKKRLQLTLDSIQQLATDTYEFAFASSSRLAFSAGQYLEWTIPAESTDTRGNRRYFTISSPPEDTFVRVGMKFYPNPSTFKSDFAKLVPGDTISASSLSGDFVLPRNKNKKLLFIAGGIGITPFISMLRSLAARNERRDIVLLYANSRETDIAYRSLLDELAPKIGMRIAHMLSAKDVPATWSGERDLINAAIIQKYVPDIGARTCYASGPNVMVQAAGHELAALGVARRRIKKDFFPGFA